MSQPSVWPLTKEAIRILIPQVQQNKMLESNQAKNCYPTAVGYYPSAYLHHMQRAENDDFILIYCVEGHGVLEINEGSYDIKKGDAFILAPGNSHTYFSDTENPWTIFWCHFKGLGAHDLFNNIYARESNLVFSVSELNIRPIFEELLDTASSMQNDKCYLHLCSVISYLLTKIERCIKNQNAKQNNNIADVQYFLRSNIAKNISLDELARVSGLSKFYFLNQYKAYTGFSPLKHFQVIKMEHAGFLLEQSKMNISEIAFATGFDDSLYFSRCFKKHYGVSPSIYRKNLNAKR